METILRPNPLSSFGRHSNLTLSERLSRAGKNWAWFLAVGIVFALTGLVAINWPVNSTVALTYALGILFAVSGILNTIQAIRLRKEETGIGWQIFLSVISFSAGALMLKYPMSGLLGVAMTLTFYFFVSAAAKMVVAFGMRPISGWGWALTSAAASFIIGVYMIATFPISALWVPGLLLGLDFVVHGSSLIGFSFRLKTMHQRIVGLADRITIESERKAA